MRRTPVLLLLAGSLLILRCRGPAVNPSPEAVGAAVPGQAFLAVPGRVLLAREVVLDVPVQLEGRLFVAGDRIRRTTRAGRKLKEVLGRARLKYGEGLEVREAERILVRVGGPETPIRLRARGHVVLLDLRARRAVRGARGLDVKGGQVRWLGDGREEGLP